MSKTPQGRDRKLTDAALRAELAAGRKPAEIGRKYGISRQAVSARVKQLGLTTAAAAVAPEESRRYVAAQLLTLEQLARNLERANRLQDACDEWLRDPDDPSKYNIGPRATEVMVTYLVEGERGKPVQRKASLQELLDEVSGVGDVVSVSSRYADPRELILKTQQETRQTLATGVELMDKIRGAREMEAFREEILAAIGEVAPEVRSAIEERLRSRLVRWAAATGLGVLGDGSGSG